MGGIAIAPYSFILLGNVEAHIDTLIILEVAMEVQFIYYLNSSAPFNLSCSR